MAGDWISHTHQSQDPKRTIKIAAMIRHASARDGCLCQVWSAANEHSVDGKLLGNLRRIHRRLTATEGVRRGVRGRRVADRRTGWGASPILTATTVTARRHG